MVRAKRNRAGVKSAALAAILVFALPGFVARIASAQVPGSPAPGADVTALRNSIGALSDQARLVSSRVDARRLRADEVIRARARLNAALQVASGAGSIVDTASLVAIRDELDRATKAFEAVVATTESHQPPESLLRVANALFQGNYRAALEILDSSSYGDNESRAYARLFSAAARFSLYRLGGERDRELVSAARDDVREAARLRPELDPTERHFSPEFVAFYLKTSGRERGTSRGAPRPKPGS